ncbi:UNVERIFIED_CONTAM: hypothetical protein Sradi_1908200 [Sesamum radiatum]|uniref:Zinc knuckle CX2CX4HX4C domain-containing protein n=1 Tax=Sesamum radiatum TaxID=300843 RepID=A0AAW2TY28_SESRA
MTDRAAARGRRAGLEPLRGRPRQRRGSSLTSLVAGRRGDSRRSGGRRGQGSLVFIPQIFAEHFVVCTKGKNKITIGKHGIIELKQQKSEHKYPRACARAPHGGSVRSDLGVSHQPTPYSHKVSHLAYLKDHKNLETYWRLVRGEETHEPIRREYSRAEETEWGGSLRIQVAINVTQPLIRALQICTTVVDEQVISFTYERLQNFCNLCGRLGHISAYYELSLRRDFRIWGKILHMGLGCELHLIAGALRSHGCLRTSLVLDVVSILIRLEVWRCSVGLGE